MSDIKQTPLLMTAENPDGWKLEELSVQLMDEMRAKDAKLTGLMAEERDCNKLAALKRARENNKAIILAFDQINRRQLDTMQAFAAFGPDQGPRGKPRIGPGSDTPSAA
jgi:hypothetical protein